MQHLKAKVFSKDPEFKSIPKLVPEMEVPPFRQPTHQNNDCILFLYFSLAYKLIHPNLVEFLCAGKNFFKTFGYELRPPLEPKF